MSFLLSLNRIQALFCSGVSIVNPTQVHDGWKQNHTVVIWPKFNVHKTFNLSCVSSGYSVSISDYEQTCFALQKQLARTGYVNSKDTGTMSIKVTSASLLLTFNPLRANPTKCSNTLKQFVGCCRQIVWMYLAILWGWH